MNNILPIGAILRERYQILEILSTKTGFGITYKVRDRNHPNQRILVIKQLKKPTSEKLKIEHLPDASSAYQNSSCALPKQTGANLTCTVDIFKVFNK